VRPLGGGEEVSLAGYLGKVLLIVNVASECGYTPQYRPLQRVFQAHQREGFEVLAFPCNQFGGQEPGDSAQIRHTCEGFGVSFRVFDKIEVNGPAEHPLYRWLKSQPGGAGEIEWNFTKFLVGKDGRLLQRFPSSAEPDSREVSAAIEKALATP
jgi:glutathione peroxidase